jgi:anti-sigma B factor antagonist
VGASRDIAVVGSVLRPRGPVRLALGKTALPELTVIKVEGELDLLTVAGLRSELDREVRQGEGDLVVDLRRVDFIDSAGLHLLLNAQRRLTRGGRSLGVVCSPGPVRRALELAKLTGTLGVVGSVRDHRRRRARPQSGRLGI